MVVRLTQVAVRKSQRRRIGISLAPADEGGNQHNIGGPADQWGDKGRDRLGIVLAIRIEGDDKNPSWLRQSIGEASAECRGLAEVDRQAHHLGPPRRAAAPVASGEPSSTTTTFQPRRRRAVTTELNPRPTRGMPAR